MARTKGVVIDTRVPPPPTQFPSTSLSESLRTSAPSGPIAHNPICSRCNLDMESFSIEDFHGHVATCTGASERSTPHNDSFLAGVLPPPESPSVGRLGNLPRVLAPAQDLPQDPPILNDLSLDSAPRTDAGHQVEKEQEEVDQVNINDIGSILAYDFRTRVYYESEEGDDVSVVEAVSVIPSVEPSINNSAKSSAKSSAAPSPEAEEPQTTLVPDGPQSVQAPQSSSESRSTTSHADVDEPQPSQNPEIAEVFASKRFPNLKTLKIILKVPTIEGYKPAQDDSMSRSVRSGSKPTSARSSSVLRPQNKIKGPKKQPFFKLNAIENFEEYLAKPEDMSYDQLYHKTAEVSRTMQMLQEEYDALDKITNDYEASKKLQAKILAEAKKVEDDKKAAETDAILLKIHAQYREEVKQPLKDYNTWLDQLQASSNAEATSPGHWEYMKQIKNPEIMSKVHKRRKQLEKQEARPTSVLEDVPLPALRKGDEEVRKRRNLLTDPVVFEDRKTADVYMADYSKHKDAIGYQVLKDRNTIPAVEEDDENGRPKRSRGKRAHDTEQTNTPGGTDSEEAPLGKRRRTARVVQDLPPSPAALRKTETRECGPQVSVSVFPKSGKRIGRPPKARGDVPPAVPKSASKSKLQQSHLPPVSEPAISRDSEDEIVAAQTPRELEPSQEAQLQEAAEALAEALAQPAIIATANPKRAGGRPKKHTLILKVQSEDESPEVKASPKKGVRAAAKPKVARGGRAKKQVEAPVEPVQLAEEDEVIQSTEQDDESRFASASTSRPTTSSSAMTTTSTARASRADSRAASREASQTASVGDPVSNVGPAVGRVRGGKRKRVGVENGALEPSQPMAPVSKKRKTAAKKPDTIAEVNEEEPVTPEPTGETVAESSTTASGRPKRKRASALPKSTYVASPDDEEDSASDGDPGDGEEFASDGESEAPAQKRRRGGKYATQKTTEPEDLSEETQPPPKRRIIHLTIGRKLVEAPAVESQETSDQSAPAPKAKGKEKGIEMQEYNYEDAGGNSSAANGGGTTRPNSEIPSGLQTGDDTDGLSTNSKSLSRKGKGKASRYTPNLESGAEQSGHDGDGEDGGSSAAQEEARKKAVKSKKLADATKKRWASGAMKGPMEKRAATNAAKKAAKDAAKGGQASGGVPASSFAPDPNFLPAP